MRKTAGYCVTGQRGGPEGKRYARIELSEKVCDSAGRSEKGCVDSSLRMCWFFFEEASFRDKNINLMLKRSGTEAGFETLYYLI